MRTIAIVMLLWICACSTVPVSSKWKESPRVLPDFASEGRLAVKQNKTGYFAQFDWQHQNEQQQLSINTPLGNTIGRLCMNNTGVSVQDYRGRVYKAQNSSQLSEKLSGLSLPLENLGAWALGFYRDARSTVRGEVLYEDGWQITRVINQANQPQKLRLMRDNLDIQIIFRHFSPGEHEDFVCP